MKDIPCASCPSMAICNAQIPLEDDPDAIDTFMVYRDCSIIRDWGEKFWTEKIGSDIWKTVLSPMKEFFNNVKRGRVYGTTILP